jgi:transcriptional regulator with XRE-family HTH domain
VFAKERFTKLGRFAEAAGITQSQLSEYLGDKVRPQEPTLTRFAELGLNLNWLFTGEGEMDAAPKKAIELDGGDMTIIHGDMTLSELADWYLSQQKEKPKKANHDHDEGEEEVNT